jgi:hypothetical protein
MLWLNTLMTEEDLKSVDTFEKLWDEKKKSILETLQRKGIVE